MTVFLVLVLGSGLAEPLASLHATPAGAQHRLAGHARALLADRLGYVPTQLQTQLPDLVDLVDELAGIGLTAVIEHLTVTA